MGETYNTCEELQGLGLHTTHYLDILKRGSH
jgi:hypothetical protein